MSLCDLNCCDLKWLQTKFDAINKKISDNQKLQDKINANIFKILKESGTDIESLLKNYYALNEDDYTKTLTSEDDINTLEPGTYKIVREDMPQNAPRGITPNGATSREYNGTLIISNSYAILFENGFLHIGMPITISNYLIWNYVINSNLINFHLQYYMLISRYSDGKFINDIHTLNQLDTGVFIINSTTQNLPVQQNGIIISRIGTATNSLFVTFIPEDSFDVYYCAKKADGTWTEWGQVAFMSDVPSLEGYATQEWVDQQIQDITGGSVTADWVKANFLAINSNVYTHITQETDITKLQPGTYYCDSNTLNQNTGIPEIVKTKTTFLIVYHCYQYIRFILQDCSTNSFYVINGAATSYYKIASESDIPSLNGYATQEWVQSQNYLTEVPDNYATDTEVARAIAAALVGYATQAWVNEQISEITGGAVTTDIVTQMISNAITGYATQEWVNSRGFLTKIPDEYVTSSELQAQNYATQTWVTGRGYQTSGQVDAAITEALNGYATQTWVNQQNFAHESDIPSLSGYATQSWINSRNFATEEWVGQQGYQTVQQVNSLIKNATADMLTQEDLDTLNYATENWVLQTALNGYATENWVNTKLNNYLPKKETIALTTQGTYYGLQYQWVRYGQIVEVFLIGNLTQQISNQLISSFCPANPLRTLQVQIPGYDSSHYAEFNDNGIKLMGTYNNELYVNCHFTYLTND